MDNVNKEPNNTGEGTPADAGSAPENKPEGQMEPGTIQKTHDSEGQVVAPIKIGDKEYQPKEIETLLKKAQDFDRSVELKRLAKLEKREGDKPKEGGEQTDDSKAVDGLNAEAIQAIIAKTLDEKLGNISQKNTNENLGTAYREFISENKWADNDEMIETISKSFDARGASSKEDLLARLDEAARRTYPIKYKENMEARIREKILAEQNNIDAGDSGATGVRQTGDQAIKPPTPEQIALAKKAGNDPRDVYPEYFKTVDPEYFKPKQPA
jgi:hypothetical protein